NGSTDNPISYTGSGPLSVIASSATGCANSDTLTFTLLPAPTPPVITPDGPLLTSTPADGYQWYFEGNLIPGATGQTHTAAASGDYTVVITAPNGCMAESEPVNVLLMGITAPSADNGFSMWPSPTTDQITVRTPSNGSGSVRITVTDARGRVVIDRRENKGGAINVPLGHAAAGTYSLRVQQGSVQWETRFVKLP
ncbi:MAG TPA: T9SS type A sorting domain-containing protein, partial [Flavobacteriales bacterium]|nr:T9SS type A sorting domain-containing protein [Flavobacteriales bacterium]